jgi:hypothetical protein
LLFAAMSDNSNKVSADDRQVSKMRRNFPNAFSSRALAYKSTRDTDIGVPTGRDVLNHDRGPQAHGEAEFWREARTGGARGTVNSHGASKGAAGFSFAVGSRVPITWKTEKEMVDSWNGQIDMA